MLSPSFPPLSTVRATFITYSAPSYPFILKQPDYKLSVVLTNVLISLSYERSHHLTRFCGLHLIDLVFKEQD